MKNYGKSFLGIALITIFCLFFNQSIRAQHKHPHAKHVHTKRVDARNSSAKIAVNQKANHRKISNANALKVVRRTNLAIAHANKVVKKNKVYTGDLSKAVHHQRYAKLLLRQRKSHRALQHSRLAREYAFKAIRHNKGSVNKEWEFNQEEKEGVGTAIQDKELDKELKTNQPNVSFDDEKVSEKELTDLEVLDMDPADYEND